MALTKNLLQKQNGLLPDNLFLVLIYFKANMSPNLSSSHFKQNGLLYEQLLLNVFSLVGIANHFHGQSLEEKLYVFFYWCPL